MSLTGHCHIGNRYVRDPVVDLSQGGLFLKTKEPASEGTPVRVALALPSGDGQDARICTLVGTVARVHRDARGLFRGLGVCFRLGDVSGPDAEALKGFVVSH